MIVDYTERTAYYHYNHPKEKFPKSVVLIQETEDGSELSLGYFPQTLAAAEIHTNDDHVSGYTLCSNCKTNLHSPFIKYCPECGAKMINLSVNSD